MNYEDLIFNDEVKFNVKKKKINKDGYYSLNICDFENGSSMYLEALGLPNGKCLCIAGCFDGVVYELFTGRIIKYVDDIDVIYDIGEQFYYFENPCYVSFNELKKEEVLDIIGCFKKNNKNSLKVYLNVLNDQFKHATSGYNELKENIDKNNVKKKIK